MLAPKATIFVWLSLVLAVAVATPSHSPPRSRSLVPKAHEHRALPARLTGPLRRQHNGAHLPRSVSKRAKRCKPKSISVAHTSTKPVFTPKTTSVPVKSTPTSIAVVVKPTTSKEPEPAPTTSSKAPEPEPTTSIKVPAPAPAPAPFTSKAQEQPKPTNSPVANPAPAPSSSAISSGGGSGSGGSTSASDIAAYLQAHNSVRSQHNANPLTWSDELATAATKWADVCQFKHSGGSLGAFGENLAAGSGDYSIQSAVKAWTDEESEYDPSNPQFSHYTQVVWRGTKQVGCAVVSCNLDVFTSNFWPAKYYVCEYFPQGNIIGQFAENVQ